MRRFRFAACMIACLAGGCAESEVRTRAANDFNCPEDKIEIVDVGGNALRASGCGERATYVCVDGGRFRGVSCVRER